MRAVLRADHATVAGGSAILNSGRRCSRWPMRVRCRCSRRCSLETDGSGAVADGRAWHGDPGAGDQPRGVLPVCTSCRSRRGTMHKSRGSGRCLKGLRRGPVGHSGAAAWRRDKDPLGRYSQEPDRRTRSPAAGPDAAAGLRRFKAKGALAPGILIVLLMDQSGWHASDRFVAPTSITIQHRPRVHLLRSPAENVRQLMGDTWLSNRLFKAAATIIDQARQPVVEQPPSRACLTAGR